MGPVTSKRSPTNVGKRGTPALVKSWKRYVMIAPTCGKVAQCVSFYKVRGDSSFRCGWVSRLGKGVMRVREKLTHRRRIRAPRVVKTATDFELGLLVFHDADERADQSFKTTLRWRGGE